MRKVDATPDEEVGKTSQGKQPGEKNGASRGKVDEGQETESKLQNDGGNGATLLVNVSEDLGSHATSSESLQSTGRGESRAICDRDNGDGDDSVEDRRQGLDSGKTNGNDERRVLGVGTVSVEKVGLEKQSAWFSRTGSWG